jgi:hypothetical protein
MQSPGQTENPGSSGGQDPGEAQPDQPGIRSRPVLLAGLAVLLVVLITGAYWLGQTRGRA